MEWGGCLPVESAEKSINTADYFLMFPASFVVGTLYDNREAFISKALMLITMTTRGTSSVKTPSALETAEMWTNTAVSSVLTTPQPGYEGTYGLGNLLLFCVFWCHCSWYCKVCVRASEAASMCPFNTMQPISTCWCWTRMGFPLVLCRLFTSICLSPLGRNVETMSSRKKRFL